MKLNAKISRKWRTRPLKLTCCTVDAAVTLSRTLFPSIFSFMNLWYRRQDFKLRHPVQNTGKLVAAWGTWHFALAPPKDAMQLDIMCNPAAAYLMVMPLSSNRVETSATYMSWLISSALSHRRARTAHWLALC